VSEADELTAAREQFREHVRAEDAILNSAKPSAAKANKHVEATDSLVRQWAKQGDSVVRAALVPLLDEQEAAVRCAAASYLLRHGASERAIAVLETISSNPEVGLVGSAAGAEPHTRGDPR
jgi:uncharacterized phage protein gp47/JayE